MSREFGDYLSGGYFQDKIESAARDCAGSDNELTRLWGAFLDELYVVAYAISSYEACDSSIDFPIMENIRQMPKLTERLNAIDKYLSSFKAVIRSAIKEHVESTLK